MITKVAIVLGFSLLLAGCGGSSQAPNVSTSTPTSSSTAPSSAPATSSPSTAASPTTQVADLKTCTLKLTGGGTVTFQYPTSFALDLRRNPPVCAGLARTSKVTGTPRAAAPTGLGVTVDNIYTFVTPVKSVTYAKYAAFAAKGGIGDFGTIDIGRLMSGKAAPGVKVVNVTTGTVDGHKATFVTQKSMASRSQGERDLIAVIDRGALYPVVFIAIEDPDGDADTLTALTNDFGPLVTSATFK